MSERDTKDTKVFVGGLAWESRKESLEAYFEQFGEILEAVVIGDKMTGRSKGYGFVTFKDGESAVRACDNANPVIDGRKANCNIACLGVPKHRSSASRKGKEKHKRSMTQSAPMYIKQAVPQETFAYYGNHGYQLYPYYPMNYLYNLYGGAYYYPVYGTTNQYPKTMIQYPYPSQQYKTNYNTDGGTSFELNKVDTADLEKTPR